MNYFDIIWHMRNIHKVVWCMRFFKLEVQEMGVVPGKDCILWTEGVSTCICILVQGTINEKPYLAMFHWDGLPSNFDRSSPHLALQLEAIVLRIFDSLRVYIKQRMGGREKPIMTSCICIGGERRSETLSGTELEVEALNTYGMNACSRYFTVTSDATFLNHHFLTTGSLSLRVVFSPDRVYWCDDREPFIEASSSEVSAEEELDECGFSTYVGHI